MEMFDAVIQAVIVRARDVKSFRCGVPEGFLFKAGQFMRVTLVVDRQEMSRYLSFSNSPTENGNIEFTKKMTGSDFSSALDRLRSGDVVKIKMPLGTFVLNETAPKQVFLCGGIGITPIRSMLKNAVDRKLPIDKVLFYSNRSEEDILFRSDLEEMAREDAGLKLVFSLDTPGACPTGWKGKCGFICAAMIREEVPDYAERIFYVCGPPVMVQSLSSILENELGVPTARIKKENFAGY